MQRGVLVVAVAALAGIAALAARDGGPWHAAATLIGGAAGVALYHAAFGFTAAWRRMARERRGAGLRAQMLLIALTCLATFPLMAYAPQLGLSAQGNILPMGLASAVGAFMFGAGMQLGGGCGSGTLFTAGGGSTRMMITLAAFVVGSVWSTAHWDVWGAWPQLNDGRGVSLLRTLGLPGAMAVMALLLGAIFLATTRLERAAHGGLEPPRPTVSWLAGPWSLVAGALALAAVGIATMLVTGRPWGVTWAFALWGGMGAEALGWPVREWPFWANARWRVAQLDAGPFAVFESVMDLGIVCGAMAAAALAGRWAPVWRLSARDVATAVVGGLLMGWGARMAYGCNIGAYLGGLVSGSLHGWWWLAFAWVGSLTGVRLRAALAMDPPLAPARAG
jgi:uncharacterized membrane protein YedE/YeeE